MEMIPEGRPLNPNDLLVKGIAYSSGCDLEVARREAQPLLDWLTDHGAHIAYDVKLPEVAKSGQRSTSRKAAASIADLKGGMKGVYDLVHAHGSHGMTDFEINAQYPGFAEANGYPKLAGDSPRKRRESLTTGCRYLVDSGRTRPNPETGREQIVWVVAVGEAQVAA